MKRAAVLFIVLAGLIVVGFGLKTVLFPPKPVQRPIGNSEAPMRTLVELRLPALTEVDDENQAVNYSKVVSAPPFALLRLTGTIKGAGVLSEGILSADTFLIADDGTRVMMGSNGTFLSIPANMEIEFSIDTFINESITKNQRFQLLLRHLDGKVGYLAHGEINLQ